MMMNPVNIGIL